MWINHETIARSIDSILSTVQRLSARVNICSSANRVVKGRMSKNSVPFNVFLQGIRGDRGSAALSRIIAIYRRQLYAKERA